MTEFEKVLADCLLELERGEANVEECLSRHPGYALQLEPILLTSLDLEYGRQARPSAAFKARVRAKLVEQMRAHPRRAARANFMGMRLATALVAIVLAVLVAGTVYAQSALPGNPFYRWKLASEALWRGVSPDPVGTDLAIATRRVQELIWVGDNPEQRALALNAYLEVLGRLRLEMNADDEARIRQVLESQTEELNRSGIFLPQREPSVPPLLAEPTATSELPLLNPTLSAPTATPGLPQVNPTLAIPTVGPIQIPNTAQPNSTPLPKIIPTVQVPSLLP